MKVQTVLGEVHAETLGVTDYHNHLYVEPASWLHKIDADFKMDSVEKSVEELTHWGKLGGKTLVELTAVDFGRNGQKLIEIARAVPDVNVILTAGYNRPYYMGRWLYAVSEDDMVRDTVRDLTVGIDNTGVKAGIIKAGSEYQNFNHEAQKLFRVAGRAHLETGKPIITHTSAGTMGMRQVEFLGEMNVSPHRIALSHMDRNPDLEEHIRIANTQAYLGYDCFGKAKYEPDSTYVKLLRGMIDAGCGSQILVGNDLGRCSYWTFKGGGPGLGYLLSEFIPRLRREGFTEDEIDALLVKNPQQFFSGIPPQAQK